MAADMDIANYYPAAEMPAMLGSLALIGMLVAAFAAAVVFEAIKAIEDARR